MKDARGYALVSSPACRALDLAKGLSREITVEPRLQELSFGDWEGRRWSDLGRAAINDWRVGLPDAAPPGGESLTALAHRCRIWLDEIAFADRPVMAITHAGPIRVICALVEGRPLLTYFDKTVPYATPVEIVMPS